MKRAFSPREIAQIQELLLEAGNEPDNQAEAAAVLRTLGEQIDLLRSDGIDDDEIAALIGQVVGATITADEMTRLHVPRRTAATASRPSPPRH